MFVVAHHSALAHAEFITLPWMQESAIGHAAPHSRSAVGVSLGLAFLLAVVLYCVVVSRPERQMVVAAQDALWRGVSHLVVVCSPGGCDEAPIFFLHSSAQSIVTPPHTHTCAATELCKALAKICVATK